jgi:hypothetical protein
MYAVFRLIKPLLCPDNHFSKIAFQDNPNKLISHINISLYFQKINPINAYFIKKSQQRKFYFRLLLSFHNLLLFLIIAL